MVRPRLFLPFLNRVNLTRKQAVWQVATLTISLRQTAWSEVVCLRHHIWEQRGVTSGGVKVRRYGIIDQSEATPPTDSTGLTSKVQKRHSTKTTFIKKRVSFIEYWP